MKEERIPNQMTLESLIFPPQYPYASSDGIDLKPEYHELWVWNEA